MRKRITKQGYNQLVWVILLLGLIGNAIFSTIGIMSGFNYYSAAYMGISLLATGFAVGLAYARSLYIEGIDKY